MKKLENIIIVEDDPIASLLLTRKLEKHPLFGQSKAFGNGKLSYDYISSTFENGDKLPDVILLDINMPVMNGWQFLDKFQNLENREKVPVIILTSSIDPQDMEKSKTYKEVKGYFLKPITDESLEQIFSIVQSL